MSYEELYGAAVTPFDEKGNVDYLEFVKICKEYEKTGHRGIVIGGSTGEGESLTLLEKRALYECATKNTKLELILGLSSCSTLKTIVEISKLQDLHPKAFLILVPAIYKAPQEGLYQHFQAIFSKFSSENFIIYNNPFRTGGSITSETYIKLHSECPNLIGIKDCSLNFDMVKTLSKVTDVYCGSDDYALDYLKAGASKYISVVSFYYYETLHDLYVEYQDGFHDLILYGYLRYIVNLLSLKVNPIGLKALMSLKGYKSMNLRLPLVPYGESELIKLKKLLPPSDSKI